MPCLYVKLIEFSINFLSTLGCLLILKGALSLKKKLFYINMKKFTLTCCNKKKLFYLCEPILWSKI